jgi:hypothetical protein
MLQFKHRLKLISLHLLILLVWTGVCQSENYIYNVKIDHLQKVLTVKTCFNSAPSYFYSTTGTAEKITTKIRWLSATDEKILRQNDGYINLPNYKKGCLAYTIETKRLKDRLNSSRFNQQHPEDFILSIGTWMWKPANYQNSTQITINFNHSPGIQVSAPWKQVKMTSTQSQYLMEHTPDDWAGYVAFGRFETETFKINNSKIQVALINGTNNYNKTNTLKWIKEMTQAVASIGGDFPIKETQVLVIFQKGSRGPVPWGQVNRGGIPGVLFIVNPDSPYDELVDDWTAAHEFSHLLVPYTPGDRWFSEGFASYYQNIARARTGLIEEKLAWKKLIAGFERGYKAAQKPGAPRLRSANMRSLMQMYWGGAVVALKADVALQKQSSGKYNLSMALAGLNDCCLHTRKSWSAKKTFQRLDEISNTTVFSEIYDNDVMQRKYPDYKKILEDLGISKSYYGDIRLDPSREKVNLRNKIING